MKTKILSPLRRDGYKAGMIMMLIALSTMMLTTACSNEDDALNNTANTENTINKGYALPVTVNVTREGDAGTRATFDGSKLNFSAGDKLFVWSYNGGSAGKYAGVLDWVSDGTFSGTIYTQNDYTGTIDALLSGGGQPAAAVLLPAGYGDYGYLSTEGNVGAYSDTFTQNYTKAFVASTTEKTAKALAVEQFSFESATYESGGFALEPNNAILNFTITGLTDGEKAVTLKNGSTTMFTGSVTPTSGTATFAMGIGSGTEINPLTLTVGGKEITITSTNTVFDAGKIYNVTRNAIPGALNGQFSVSSTKKVYFSKGNLQATYDGSNWTWAFAANQWDYIGNAADNTMVTATSPFISENATVDLFGWVGASSTWTGVNKYGITSSSATNNKNGYGNVASESLKSDWGALIGLGWRTLSMAEWTYLLATRTVNGGKGADKSYTLNKTVNGKRGMVIYPDNYTGAVYSGSNWASFEAAGCVFLPAAGWRNGTTIDNINDRGFYWSSTPATTTDAKRMFFAGGLDLSDTNSRAFGFSVRLVREVE